MPEGRKRMRRDEGGWVDRGLPGATRAPAWETDRKLRLILGQKQRFLSPESDGDLNFEILALSRPPFLRRPAASESAQLAILPSQLTTHCLCNPTGALRFVCKAVTHVYTTVWGGVRAPRVRE